MVPINKGEQGRRVYQRVKASNFGVQGPHRRKGGTTVGGEIIELEGEDQWVKLGINSNKSDKGKR